MDGFDLLDPRCLIRPVLVYPGFKISAKFCRNFMNFYNFGGGRKKNPKFCYTNHVLYNSNPYFLLFMLYVLLLNRCAIINYANICLDLFF
jgi:hypothetical protein